MKIYDYSQINNSLPLDSHSPATNKTLETITATLLFLVPALILLAIAAN